jgi:hypothetical protein
MRVLGLGVIVMLAAGLVAPTSPGAEAGQKVQKDQATTMTAIALAESRKKKGLKVRAKSGRQAKDLGSWSKAQGLDVTWETPSAKKKVNEPKSRTLCAPVGGSKPQARC